MSRQSPGSPWGALLHVVLAHRNAPCTAAHRLGKDAFHISLMKSFGAVSAPGRRTYRTSALLWNLNTRNPAFFRSSRCRFAEVDPWEVGRSQHVHEPLRLCHIECTLALERVAWSLLLLLFQYLDTMVQLVHLLLQGDDHPILGGASQVFHRDCSIS